MNKKQDKIYKIQEKSKYDLQFPKWKNEKFYTNGKKYLSFKQAKEQKKKLQKMSSFSIYKIIEDII